MNTHMTIKHHLNEQLLMGYAAGILPEAFSLVIATQVSISDEARARLESYEAIGGGMFRAASYSAPICRAATTRRRNTACATTIRAPVLTIARTSRTSATAPTMRSTPATPSKPTAPISS